MELEDIILPSEEEIKQNLGLGKDLRKNNPYGFLIALYPLKERKNGALQWFVYNTNTKNTFIARADRIVLGNATGKTKSEAILENNAKKAKDLKNQKFGKLLALEPTQERYNRCIIWKCQCECGNIHYVPSNRLLTGHTQSCGCLNQSHGELTIETLLKENNIKYKKEYTVKINNTYYRFDFVILNEQEEVQYFIEYDGEQHFKDNSHFLWHNKEQLSDIMKKDELKNNYCKDNNIPLIRIPYTHKKIKLMDLLLSKSIFILK